MALPTRAKHFTVVKNSKRPFPLKSWIYNFFHKFTSVTNVSEKLEPGKAQYFTT